ncbi:MAG TPA: sodium-dependent bicarbonate transport family permease [Polyangiaceae bacterium LLY-WYZ-14_1]|nr:sodium-dependent bicarbonate transport family permease [Polyangiaceae bacterium LLY-WYZ-14_1]
MDLLANLASTFAAQVQSPTLGFLLGGMLVAALGSRLEVPDAIYKFVVFMLLIRIGLEAGMEIREAELASIFLPVLAAAVVGCAIVLAGRAVLPRLPGVKVEDGIATAGLFGAVSASTLAAALVVLDEAGVQFEAWVPALYPFMDIPALILAIVLASVHQKRAEGVDPGKIGYGAIVVDSLRGSAVSALLLGIVLGLFTHPESVFESFYDPLFRGLLSILMLVLGIEAWSRLSELRGVAHWYAVYAFIAPLLHGLLAFGLGYLLHLATGFSPGGVILFAVIAASNSDISGPPTLRAGIPRANPSAYIGSSTAIGTPMAIGVGIPLYLTLAQLVFGP